jgi:phospholipid/cholesterol/gamma-HCH transport system substrate-binding protein
MSGNIRFKVGLFLILSFAMIIFSAFFVLVVKDVFTEHRTYRLSSDSGDGLTVGMSVLFSGFQVGRVERLELSEEGIVLITLKIPERHSKWFRKNSVFTLEKPFIGSPRITVRTPGMAKEPLDDSEIIEIQTVDDINEVIKKAQPILERIDTIAENVEALIQKDSELMIAISNIEKITTELAKSDGLLEMLTGDKESAESLRKTLRGLPEIVEETRTAVSKINTVIEEAQEKLLGEGGTVTSVNSILESVDEKVKDLDKIMQNLIEISDDIKGGTKDINLLREEIDEAISSANRLVKDIRNNLPFEQEKEIKLP